MDRNETKPPLATCQLPQPSKTVNYMQQADTSLRLCLPCLELAGKSSGAVAHLLTFTKKHSSKCHFEFVDVYCCYCSFFFLLGNPFRAGLKGKPKEKPPLFGSLPNFETPFVKVTLTNQVSLQLVFYLLCSFVVWCLLRVFSCFFIWNIPRKIEKRCHDQPLEFFASIKAAASEPAGSGCAACLSARQ